MTVQQYIENVGSYVQKGVTDQSVYRANLQKLLESLLSNVEIATNPKCISCGAPDFFFKQEDKSIGYLVAADIGERVPGEKAPETLVRYRDALPNLVITNYIDFRFYRRGELITSVSIGDVENGKLGLAPEGVAPLAEMLEGFLNYTAVPITSSVELARKMARKTRLLANIIEDAIKSDETDGLTQLESTLGEQLKAFQSFLEPDLELGEFADNYAQTIAYGMLAARLHDPTLDSFSRQEAAELIPEMHPFLQKLFRYIGSNDIDDRISWIVDALADMFRVTDVGSLLDDFVVTSPGRDPVISFYENFWEEFDPALQKNSEVPQSIVDFIVRSSDEILKKEFGLRRGLADVSKTSVNLSADGQDADSEADVKLQEKEMHKVQILDPSSKTGAFLAEVIKQIYKDFEGQQGVWTRYVENHLIPRLNGFEILMASYAMSHLKLDMLLRETGYKREGNQRFRVFLANFLEDSYADSKTTFERWLNEEATEAQHIKHDTPVMVIMGKPPFSKKTVNKGSWISKLMKDYKVEPGSEKPLQEKSFEWINNDYVKFLRYGQYFVEKNGKGVLSFINPDIFLDDPVYRGMRWSLLKTFDKIFTIDLHGDIPTNRNNSDDNKDENICDTRQGISINFFIKTGEKNSNRLGKIYHYDLYGSRDTKNEFLSEKDIGDIEFNLVEKVEPYYFYTKEKFVKYKTYLNGFAIDELFNTKAGGIRVKKKDTAQVSNDNSSETLQQCLLFNRRSADKRKKKKELLVSGMPYSSGYQKILYRPFDIRYAYFKNGDKKGQGFSLNEGAEHFLQGDNMGLILPEINNIEAGRCIFLTKDIASDCIFNGCESSTIFPLYLYPGEKESEGVANQHKRLLNLNTRLVEEISYQLELSYVPDKEDGERGFTHYDLLDYMYAVLNSSTYQKRYDEFLKKGFPRVPYPKDERIFWKLVRLGRKLRKVHLMEHPIVYDFITTFPVEGSDELVPSLNGKNAAFVSYSKKDRELSVSGIYDRYPNEELGRVYINETQYFGGVPRKAWNYSLGGYYPAKQWLKDRQSRKLSFEEIQHFQAMIVALMETSYTVERIDKIEIQNQAVTEESLDIFD